MPTIYKVLGQSNPAATTATTLYTVPSSTETVVSTISVANISASPITFRIAIRPNAATLAAQHYLAFDQSLPANSTTAFTLGITLDAADVITVYASDTNGVFQAFGSEIS